MSPKTAEKLLTILLRLDGLFMCTAVFAIFFPDSLMNFTHQRLGLGEMPTNEIAEYLARSCSALYAMHGAIVFYVALTPRKFWRLVRWILLLHISLGLVLFGIDLNAGMPWFWTLCEGLPISAFAGFMLWLWARAGLPTKSAAGSQ